MKIRLLVATLFLMVIIDSCRTTLPVNYFKQSEAESIVQNIKRPTDSKNSIQLDDYNPDKTGQTDARPAFLMALLKIEAEKGGILVVNSGNYRLDGPLHLVDNLHIKLEKGATLNFTPEAKHYLPAVKVRWEGTVCWNYSPMIYGYKKRNITISGEGIINGNGAEWSKDWRAKQKNDQNTLRKMGNDLTDENTRIFANGQADTNGDGVLEGNGKAYFLRPGLVHLFDCEQVLFDGNTFLNSPFWTINLPFTDHLIIRNVKVKGELLNDDGIDPDSSQEVLIENCDIDTHDDAISIKAGRDQDAWARGGSKNIVVRNCKLKSTTNTFCIGSEMSGGVENVYVQNCTMDGAEYAINLKSNLDRGGEVKNIYLKDLIINEVKKSVVNFTMAYHSWRGNDFPTKFHKIYLNNITAKQANETAISIIGVEKSLISQVFLKNVTVEKASQDLALKFIENIHFENVKINGEAIENNNSVENDLILIEKSRFGALVQKDYETLNIIFSDRLVYVHADGKIDGKKSFMEGLKNGTRTYKNIALEAIQVRVFKKSAVLNGDVVFVRMNKKGEQIPQKLRYTGVYVRSKNRWKMVSWHSTDITDKK